MVVKRKSNLFSLVQDEIFSSPRIQLQIWDADSFSADDQLGECSMQYLYAVCSIQYAVCSNHVNVQICLNLDVVPLSYLCAQKHHYSQLVVMDYFKKSNSYTIIILRHPRARSPPHAKRKETITTGQAGHAGCQLHWANDQFVPTESMPRVVAFRG